MITWYKQLPSIFYSELELAPFHGANLFLWNTNVAEQLGVGAFDLSEVKSGIAMAYAGHQFGHLNVLGDGRAMLIDEMINSENVLYDLHLKGSGPTRYSRRGDGWATRSSMVREFIVSECMHELGVPTSRSLFVYDTNQMVQRLQLERGGILGRISKSMVRVGTFEFASYMTSKEELKIFTDQTIQRLYPEIKSKENPYLELLRVVRDKQIELIVHWMRIGFIHGVMNTDNMSIAGETIDYGPCAFMNAYNENQVYSSIDREGRYAFGRQPAIAQWNLWAFAHSLLPLIHEQELVALEMAREIISAFPDLFGHAYYKMMCAKLGLKFNGENEKKSFVEETLAMLHSHSLDFTQFFRNRTHQINSDLQTHEDMLNWHQRWSALKDDSTAALEGMRAANPNAIPRNTLIEALVQRVDSSEIYEALEAFKRATHSVNEAIEFEKDYLHDAVSYQTFCGT